MILRMQVQTQTHQLISPSIMQLQQTVDQSADYLLSRGDSVSTDPAAQARLEAIGARHGFGLDAARVMAQAITRGGGGMAQFQHPALGGSGQWMRGGMVMIGDMFNRELASRVGALGNDLSDWLQADPAAQAESKPRSATGIPAHDPADNARVSNNVWWPAGLHGPSTSGAQNGVRYAYFKDARRLAIERDGSVELYDTGEHCIGGVSQQQGSAGGGTFQFNSQHGPVDLASLRRLDAPSSVRTHPLSNAVSQPTTLKQPATSRDALDLLAKLVDLHARGVLSNEEFTTKKSDLLRRI